MVALLLADVSLGCFSRLRNLKRDIKEKARDIKDKAKEIVGLDSDDDDDKEGLTSKTSVKSENTGKGFSYSVETYTSDTSKKAVELKPAKRVKPRRKSTQKKKKAEKKKESTTTVSYEYVPAATPVLTTYYVSPASTTYHHTYYNPVYAW